MTLHSDWHGEPPQEQQATDPRSLPPDQVRISWRDKSISLVGLHTVVVLLLAVALTWMGILLDRSVTGTQTALREAIEQHTSEQSREHAAISDDVRRNLGKINAGQEKIADAMDSQTYLMTKTDKERQLYKLDMPDSLRKRIR